MERQKAYEILNQALSQIQANRQTHQVLIEALNVLFMTAPVKTADNVLKAVEKNAAEAAAKQ